MANFDWLNTSIAPMRHSLYILLFSSLLLGSSCSQPVDFSKLPDTSVIDQYVTLFNADDDELYKQYVPNENAAEFLKENIPLFECPDKELEKTYYFRWWTFRKHIKKTPDGFVITEFLPQVSWSKKHNTINCAAQHHMAEGRWLHDSKFLESYAHFWFRGGGEPRQYSLAAASAIWDLFLVNGNKSLVSDLYDDLKLNFASWEESRRDSTGLFWQVDGLDGGELSCSGALSPDASGYRPNLNSYMYGDATALAKMARLLGKTEDGLFYSEKAEQIKRLVDEKLWDGKDQFYKVIPRFKDGSPAPCREELGYIPFAYDLADEDKLTAWEQLFDPEGFQAPYGPTTCEQRYPGYAISYEGHECQWNGPSWPYATSQTLNGMYHSLQRFGENVLTRERFFDVLQTYSNSHRKDGKCWIDENLNPNTGDWISRTRLMSWENGTWSEEKGGKERGKDYNHSTFVDIIISGLVGLSADENGQISVRPLVPEGLWDWWCLRDARIAGKSVTVVYDRTGKHYGVGKGLSVFSSDSSGLLD